MHDQVGVFDENRVVGTAWNFEVFQKKKVVSRFVTKNVSAFLEYFLSVNPLVHAKLIIGRLPSFMFFRSLDSMVGVARQKRALNMLDPYQFLWHIFENRP